MFLKRQVVFAPAYKFNYTFATLLTGTLTGYSVFSTLVAALTAADLVDALDGEGQGLALVHFLSPT